MARYIFEDNNGPYCVIDTDAHDDDDKDPNGISATCGNPPCEQRKLIYRQGKGFVCPQCLSFWPYNTSNGSPALTRLNESTLQNKFLPLADDTGNVNATKKTENFIVPIPRETRSRFSMPADGEDYAEMRRSEYESRFESLSPEEQRFQKWIESLGATSYTEIEHKTGERGTVNAQDMADKIRDQKLREQRNSETARRQRYHNSLRRNAELIGKPTRRIQYY